MKTLKTLLLLVVAMILLLSVPAYGDAIAIDETNNSKIVGNVTDIQVGSVSLCEAAGLALDKGSCINRPPNGFETSDVVYFSITADGKLKIDLGSDLESGEAAPPADTSTNLSTTDPAWSISEPDAACEGCVQTFLYEPEVGQPGFAKDSSGATLTYQITSDVPEPATWFLFGTALTALFGVRLKRLGRSH